MSSRITKNKSNRNAELERLVLNGFKSSYTQQENKQTGPFIKNQVCKYGNRCNNPSCYRVHSQDEWWVPDCEHGNDCNRQNGTFDRVRKVLHPEKKCKCAHPNETVESYCKRLGNYCPEGGFSSLPETRSVDCMELFPDEE